MTTEKTYTVSQIAASIGVDRQRVYRYLNAENVAPVAGSKPQQRKQYDEAAKDKAAAHFARVLSQEQSQTSQEAEASKTLVQDLRNQLADVKAQRDKLDGRLDDALAQNRALMLSNTNLTAALTQALAAPAPDDSTTDDDKVAPDHPAPSDQSQERRHWWKRLFG